MINADELVVFVSFTRTQTHQTCAFAQKDPGTVSLPSESHAYPQQLQRGFLAGQS